MSRRIAFVNFASLEWGAPGGAVLLVENGMIRKIGKPSLLSEGDWLEIDLGGRFLTAGFIDAHCHFLHSGLQMMRPSLRGIFSLGQAVEKLESGEGQEEWLQAVDFEAETAPEAVFSLLNRAFPSRPAVLYRADWHGCYVNRCALLQLNLPGALRCGSVASGYFSGKANLWLQKYLVDRLGDADRDRAFKAVSELAFSRGVTAVHALEGGEGWGYGDPEYLLRERRGGPRIVLYPQTVNLSWPLSRGIPRIGGCLLLDGSIGSRTAAIRGFYADAPDRAGELYFSDRALGSFVGRSHRAGLQLAFHAIGDRAVRQILLCYRDALKRDPRSDHRHRIEHCELAGDEELALAAELGVYFSVQPSFDYFWGGPGRLYEKRLGRERAASANRFRAYLNAGIRLGGGSDFDVTPLDPLLGIYAAVNHSDSRQRLTAAEALRLFTSWNAGLSFDEHRFGRLAEGMKADLAVLSGDVLSCAPEKIGEVKVDMTFLEGHCVYGGHIPAFSSSRQERSLPDKK